MANPSKVSFSNTHSSIEDIEEYYVDSGLSLDQFFSFSDLTTVSARYFGFTMAEMDAALKFRKETLDRMCSLELLAALEARIRIDYLVRCQNRKKDNLSKNLRIIYKQRGNKAYLVDDILLTWKLECPEHKTLIDNFEKALDFRNWLAHGRYWIAKKNPHIYKYDYLSTYALADSILNNIFLYEAA